MLAALLSLALGAGLYEGLAGERSSSAPAARFRAASRLRTAVSQSINGEPPKRGGILAALRRSPLVAADLDVTRPREKGRNVEI